MAKSHAIDSKVAEPLQLEHFRFEVDADGVATVLMDVAGEKVNTLSPRVQADLEKIITRLEDDPAIRAVVIGSAKKEGFIAGADVSMLERVKNVKDAVA